MNDLISHPMQRTSPWSQRQTWSGQSASGAEITDRISRLCLTDVAWDREALKRRAAIAIRYAEVLTSKKERLADLICEEVGKTWSEAQAEVTTAIAKVQVSLDALQNGRTTRKNDFGEIRFRPVGVMLVLGPFNFPLHLPGSHMVPAILAGNHVLFKPSEFAPAIGEALVQCWYEAGLEASELQIIQGSAEVAQHAIADSRINGVLFTGSRRAGQAIHQQLAGRPEVILALEMGGNNPLIVIEPNETERSVEIAVQSAFVTSGQRCTCARRILLVESPQSNHFFEAFCSRTKALVIGHPKQHPEPFIGPLIHERAVQAALAYQQRWIDAGGKAILLAKQSDSCSALISPGIMDVTNVTEPFDEECFAPIVTIQRVDTLENAIKLARSTQYGLAAGLIGGTESQFEALVNAVPAGVIYWNKPTTGASGRLPFGGLGYSGNHRASASFAAEYCSDPIAIQRS